LPPRLNAMRPLEVEPNGELQLTHHRAAFEAGNFSIVATRTVDTRLRPVVGTESVDRVVKDVEGIHAELRRQFLRDPESLRNGGIGIEAGGPVVRVSSHVPQVSRPGISKDTRVGRDVSNRRVESDRVIDRVQLAYSRAQASRPLVRTADTHVLIITAFAVAWRPW